MAGKGGYQAPRKPAAASGPGSKSQRTDGSQMKAAPDFDDPNQKFGDQQAQLQAQTAVPLSTSSPGPGPRQTSSPSAGAGRGLPPEVFMMDSKRPNEPTTAGLGIGAGEGPSAPAVSDDTRELVLEYLARQYNNLDAAQMLNDIRGQAAQAPAMMAPGGGADVGLEAPGPSGGGEPNVPVEHGLDGGADSGFDPDLEDDFLEDDDDEVPAGDGAADEAVL